MSALPYLAWVLALSNFLPLQWQQVPNWGLWSPGLASLFPLPIIGVRDVFQKHYLIKCSTTESLLLLPMLSQSLVQGVNTSAFLICITSLLFPAQNGLYFRHWALEGLSSAVFHTWLGCRSSWTCPLDRLLFQDISPRKSFLTPLSWPKPHILSVF